MAKYKSHVFADIRGKVSGLVYSKNRFGNYTRRLVAPVQPRTDDQLLWRHWFTSHTQYWRSLTEEQRAAWRQWAENWNKTDSLGDPVRVTGSQAFVALHAYRRLFGLGLEATPPNIQPSGFALTSLSLTAGVLAGALTMSLDFTPTPIADWGIVILATPPLSPGINFTGRSLYRVIGTRTPPVASPLDIADDYENKFGVPPVGTRVFVRVLPVTWSTASQNRCFPGSPLEASAIVQNA